MLKRGKELARAAGEAIGILAPSLPDAQTAAEQHRQSLVVAQRAIETAEQALHAAHDLGAEDVEIERTEAALAAAIREATRAEARYRGSETRLQKARDAEAAKAKDAHRVKLDAALAIRAECAKRIDLLAASLGEQVREIDAQDEIISEASRAGVAAKHSGYMPGRARQCVQVALSQHGVIPRTYLGDPTQHPGAADTILRENGALTS
jgi:predicted alpha/beta hydrolase